MKLSELARKSREAAEVRAYQTHPDVTALRIERVRGWSGGLIWAGVVLGLAFTMVNVQTFAASGAPLGSLAWCSAWLLDPMVSLVLIGVLVAEQVTSRWELDTPRWARNTKWFAVTATYVMNTWQPWAHLAPAGIVLHSVPPLLVFCAVEGGPAMREALTKAVARSLMAPVNPAVNGTPDTATNPTGEVHEPVHEATAEPVQDVASGPVHDTTPATTPAPVRVPRPRRAVNARRKGGRGKRTGGRVLFADYLATARQQVAETRPAAITPAWCRAVTGCSAGTSVKLAAALATEPDEHTHTAATSPDAVAVAAAPTEPLTVLPAGPDVPDDSTEITTELEGEAA